MLYMVNHVLLHMSNQMLIDQVLNLLHSIWYLYKELNSCDNVGRIATYLYFFNFIFNRFPSFIDYKELFINVQFFGFHIISNFGIIKLYPYK